MFRYTFLFSIMFVSTGVLAQREAEVHGTSMFEVGEDADITFRQAKIKCLALAKADAIKSEFGEIVTSDVIDTNVETNGESASSFFWENTVAMAKGEWLVDRKPPVFNIEYFDGKLVFEAEVWGIAREIIQSKIDLKWKIQKDGDGKKVETSQIESGQKMYVTLRSPADGYLAVYLNELEDDITDCLLPYKRDTSGRYQIKGGEEYVLFDTNLRDREPFVNPCILKTKRVNEESQLILIYSPNPIPLCDYNKGKSRKEANWITTHDFQKWLLKCQRADKHMVVFKKNVTIIGKDNHE